MNLFRLLMTVCFLLVLSATANAGIFKHRGKCGASSAATASTNTTQSTQTVQTTTQARTTAQVQMNQATVASGCANGSCNTSARTGIFGRRR